MKILFLTFISLISFECFSSEFLLSKYNSLEANYSFVSDHEFHASTLGYNIKFKPENLNIIFNHGGTINKYDITIGMIDLPDDIDCYLNRFGAGFLFSYKNLNIIPSIEFGIGDLSVLSTDVETLNLVDLAITIRSLISDKIAISYSLHHLDYGDLSISQSNRVLLNNRLLSSTSSTLSDADFNEFENTQFEAVNVFSIEIDQHFRNDLYANYGISFEKIFSKISNPRISFSLGYSY